MICEQLHHKEHNKRTNYHVNRQHRYLYSKNLAKPQSETLFEEDLKFMELLLSKNKDLVKIKKIKDEERGIETTYITIKKTE